MVIFVDELSQLYWDNVVWKLFLTWMPKHQSKGIKVFIRDESRVIIQWVITGSVWSRIILGMGNLPVCSTLAEINLSQGLTSLLKKIMAVLERGEVAITSHVTKLWQCMHAVANMRLLEKQRNGVLLYCWAYLTAPESWTQNIWIEAVCGEKGLISLLAASMISPGKG